MNNNQNNEIKKIQNETTPNSYTSTYDKSQNKKTTILFIGIIVFFISLIVGVIVYIYTTIKNTIEKYDNEDNNKITETSKLQNGIYELNGIQIKIFQNKFTHYKIENPTAGCLNYDVYERCIFTSIPYENETINEQLFLNNVEIKGNTNELIVTSDSYELPSGTYTKIKNYTEEDFKNEAIGNIKYLNTNINGIFQNDNITIEVFQLDEEYAAIKIETPSMVHQSREKIKNNMIISEDNEYYSIQMIFTNKSLTISSYDEIPDSILNSINGTYTKIKNITADDIYNDMY